jgi:spore maturation protein CgeB
MRFFCFGSSLVSAYWNGAATYYRGLLNALAARGHKITFAEPDAYNRQAHRDIENPAWAEVLVYQPDLHGMESMLKHAAFADVLVKFSGVGMLDEELERAILSIRRSHQLAIFWDVDAPATLDRMQSSPSDALRKLVPQYDAVFTYGGGDAVVRAYMRLGAQNCVPVYNALDPATHYPVRPDPRFESDLAFLGNRLPDREARVEEYFFKAANRLAQCHFILGGSGWADKALPPNVAYAGHVYTRDHNAFNCTPKAVLNINRESMARYGASPPTRIFEAAGAGACIISDSWPGILLAVTAEDVAGHLSTLEPQRARLIGAAARKRVLREHTYALRAQQVERILDPGANLSEAV